MQNKLRFSELYIEVICDRLDIATQQKVAKFYPVTNNRTNTSFHLSPRFIPEVLKEFRDIDDTNINSVPQQIKDLYEAEITSRDNVKRLLRDGPSESPVVNEYLTLDAHQQLGREIAKYRSRFAFFYDTRTGKTPMSLTIIHDDLQVNPDHKWLIVCPLILIDNAWIEDARRFFPDLQIVSVHAATRKERLHRLYKDASVYVTNTESFHTYAPEFEKCNFYGCFVDESSSMKSAKTKTSKRLVEYAQEVKRFYLLSGTPAPNGEWEYYMQLKAIDLYGVQQSYSRFKDRYFTNVSYNPQYEKLAIRPDREDELKALIKNYAIYVDKEDVLDTPGRTFHELEIEMPEELKKHYRKMKNDLYVEIVDSGADITAPSTAAKLNKLNQISSGFIIDTKAKKDNELFGDEKPTWYLLDTYRFDYLDKLLESLGDEQVLIWCNYHIEFDEIKKRLGDKCRCVYGQTSINEKNEAIRLFKDGTIQYLIANPQSADKGLTLTNTHIAIYFSLSWSYEYYKQSTERIYGSIRSQKKHCDYYILIAKGSIDRILYSEVLQGKQNASYHILNHLKGGKDAT